MTADALTVTGTHRISHVRALEILDSRNCPTLQVTVTLADGIAATAGVPSGSSIGSGEAAERRDHDLRRYRGLGVCGAVEAVRGPIADLLRGQEWRSLEEIDAALIELDGTPGKARLGANAIIGASMACARALACADGCELWDWLSPPQVPPQLPVPHFNLIDGGVHARDGLDFQAFMVAPVGAPSVAEAVRAGSETYKALHLLLSYRGHETGIGDEGGFAPQLTEPEEALRLLVMAIQEAGYEAGRAGVVIALDAAASRLRDRQGRYQLGGQRLSSDEMIERYAEITRDFPVWLIEDGLSEDDWDGWAALTARLGERTQLAGDDIFATNPEVITKAIARGVGNAAVIKVNQIGTVTETMEAMAACRRGGYQQLVSHRSGETPDTFISDLAVGSGCGELKAGAPARGERVAKYNRLLEIAASRPDLCYGLADF